MGMFEEEVSPYVEQSYRLQPGDSVFIYTDGITEWQNPNGEEFGLERLKQLLQKYSDRPVKSALNSLLDVLQTFAGGRPCDDDLTIVGLRYQPD